MLVIYSRVLTCTKVVATGIQSESILRGELRGSADDSDAGSERKRSQRGLKFWPGQLTGRIKFSCLR